MGNHNAGLVPPLLVFLFLCLGLLDWLSYIIYRLGNIVTAGLYKLVL